LAAIAGLKTYQGSKCGVESFAQGRKPDGSEHVAVNVRCLEGVDIATLETMPFDGRSR
jgi:hypothetical protein